MGEERLDSNLDVIVRLKMVQRVIGCELDRLEVGQEELGEALLGAIEVIGDCVERLEDR